MAKRGGKKGFGTVLLRKDTRRWVAELDLGVDASGKRLVWRYSPPADHPEPYADAKTMLARAVAERSRGTDLMSHDQTTADYLAYWLAQSITPNRAPRTLESYEGIVRLHLGPALGTVPIRSLAPTHVVSMFGAMRDRGIGARHQALAFAVLHAALHQAVRWGVVGQNVCDRVDKPKHRTVEKATFTPCQLAAFLVAIRGDRLEALWITAAALGLRSGELTGLRWVDLDGDAIKTAYQLQRIGGEYVLREHKTTRSKRTLPLPPYVAAALKAHRVRQLEERMAAGAKWANSLDLIFATPTGHPLNGSRVSHRFRQIILAAGLPDLDLHDLRRTAGSMLASLGTSAPVIRDLLGHSQLSTTGRYPHSLPSEHVEACNRLGRLLEPP